MAMKAKGSSPAKVHVELCAPGKTVAQLFGDDTPPATTRQRLVEAALELFYTQGFHAVGLDQILAAVGISKQAFYKHFESKDDLAVEAIALRDKRESAAFSRQVMEKAGGVPKKALLAVFDVLDEWFNHPDYRGCLFLTACAEFPAPHDPIHKTAAANYAAAERDIEKLAVAAGAKNPKELAHELVLLAQGAVTRRLVFADNASAQHARRLAEMAVARQTKR